MEKKTDPQGLHRSVFEMDNLPVLRGMDSGSVDLIYLDPPFNSNRTYAAPAESPAAGAGFKDAWTLSDVDSLEQTRLKCDRPSLYSLIRAAGQSHSQGMFAYLVMMAPRLIEMQRVLKDTGSIYLHCDPSASHYLKTLMDAIFGAPNFRNEIVWFYRRYAASANHFQRMHDVILFYTNTGEKGTYTFHPLYVETSSTRAPMKRGYNTNTYRQQGERRRQIIVEDEEAFRKSVEAGTVDPAEYDRVVRRKNRGTPAFDVFEIPVLNPQSAERVGYPTQKPLALLERIIQASSNEGDLVLDPFCGCATTMVAAERLGRKWCGMDVSGAAAKLVVQRMQETPGRCAGEDISHRKTAPIRTDR